MNENIVRYKPLIYLIKCALNGTKPETSALADADFDELERLGASIQFPPWRAVRL